MTPTLQTISEVTAIRLVYASLVATFHRPIEQILSRARTSEVAFIRQLGMAALIDQFNFTQHSAAEAFGRKCHATAMHAAATVKVHVLHSPARRKHVAAFLQILSSKRQTITSN